MDAAPELVLDVVEVLASLPRPSGGAAGDLSLRSRGDSGGSRSLRPETAVLLRRRRGQRRAFPVGSGAHPRGGAPRMVHSGKDRLRRGASRARRRGEDRNPHDVSPAGQRAEAGAGTEPRPAFPWADAGRRLQQRVHVGGIVRGAAAYFVITISTRRFFCRASGSSLPSGF